MLQLLAIAAALIGSTQAALPNAQEFATSTLSTAALANVDALLAFPQQQQQQQDTTADTFNSNSNSDTKSSSSSSISNIQANGKIQIL